MTTKKPRKKPFKLDYRVCENCRRLQPARRGVPQYPGGCACWRVRQSTPEGGLNGY